MKAVEPHAVSKKKKITDDSCRRKTVEEVMKKHK